MVKQIFFLEEKLSSVEGKFKTIISLYHYNSKQEIDFLIDCLNKVVNILKK